MQPSKNPYEKTQAATRSQRSFEANVFRSMNYAMRKARDENDNIEIAKAVSNNYLLWQTLLHDVLNEDNKLPVELRRGIAIVARTVIKEIDENINGTLDIDFLISINTTMIEGLSAASGE